MGRRKQPTTEQKQKAEARRAKFRGLVKRVAEMTAEQRAEFSARVGTVPTCAGRLLSVYNTCLLIMQLETVTMVGGLQQWREVGRRVKKGSQGLMIWAPIGPKTSEPTKEEADDEKVRFMPVYVFDVTQTIGIDEVEEGAELYATTFEGRIRLLNDTYPMLWTKESDAQQAIDTLQCSPESRASLAVLTVDRNNFKLSKCSVDGHLPWEMRDSYDEEDAA